MERRAESERNEKFRVESGKSEELRAESIIE
jgi:hypothetical protein